MGLLHQGTQLREPKLVRMVPRGRTRMRKRRVLAINLEAVAQKAGVSTSTVSRVLNNLDVVKNSTRTRVMKAAEELNYHPNLHARSLAHWRSRRQRGLRSRIGDAQKQNSKPNEGWYAHRKAPSWRMGRENGSHDRKPSKSSRGERDHFSVANL